MRHKNLILLGPEHSVHHDAKATRADLIPSRASRGMDGRHHPKDDLYDDRSISQVIAALNCPCNGLMKWCYPHSLDF